MKRIAMVIALLGAACGKDGGGGGGSAAGGGAGGPPCSEAAANYVDLMVKGGGNPLYSLKPTSEQVKAVTALVEASCTAGWSADTRTCVIATKSNFETGKCWKESMDALRVSQVVHDFVQAEKAKPASSPPPAAGSGSAAAAAGSAGAPVVLPPVGEGSAIGAGSGVPAAPAAGSADAGSAAGSAAVPTALALGDRVMARWTNGSWYPGKISAVNADGTYNVHYDDGDNSKNLPIAKVKKRAKSTGGGGGTSSSSSTSSDAPCPGPGITRRCGGRCVNIQEDDNNCGGCGTVCSGGKHCDGHLFCRDADGNL